VSLGDGHELVRLRNGTFSVRARAYAETMHPGLGPTAEAEALYVRQLRMVERLAFHQGEFVVWDVGMGAAANALTVLRATRGLAAKLRLVSFDNSAGSLEFALKHTRELGYFEGWESLVHRLLDERTATRADTTGSVNWELHLADFPSLLREAPAQLLPKPDAILFDPFSPARNPAMWTQPLFADLFGLLNPSRPCALATYSRSTMLRVTLLLAGFFVGHGKATGMKEETTVAANALELIAEPLDRSWLDRARRSASAEPLWTPGYRQAPLEPATWERLRAHPQFD